MLLHQLVADSAARDPSSLAVAGPDAQLSYGRLDALANRMARTLQDAGVGPGDRVGLFLEKSATAVVAMQAILRLGAAYVPIDPQMPSARARRITDDCAMAAVVTTSPRARALGDGAPSPLIVDACVTRGDWSPLAPFSSDPLPEPRIRETSLAYILYTSGSTGAPKGVCLSHGNALAFVGWAARTLDARPEDRFSNHAPFHFDLSVLDLYAAFAAGASVHIVPEGASYLPAHLSAFILERGITVWYSVPSALILMMEQGGLLEAETTPLRAVLFAGEPFPPAQLARLCRRWPGLRYLNLYGPTETNVCTAYEVSPQAEDFSQPLPIGLPTCGDEVFIQADEGGDPSEGELYVSGPTVMLGYWGKEPQGDRPYPTGDRVRRREDGQLLYLGRRDQMLKVRGYRVEAGEIEAALEQHPAVGRAAVIKVGEGMDAALWAFLVSSAAAAPSLLAVKAHLAERLPAYMQVDRVIPVEALPLSRNGKVDRRALAARAAEV